MQADGRAVQFMLGEDLWEHDSAAGGLRQLTRRHNVLAAKTDVALWLEAEQRELFETQREADRLKDAAEARERRLPGASQAIPAEPGQKLEHIRLSPGRDYVTFIARTPSKERVPTRYLDYATRSGYAEVSEARPKVGEPQDELRMGIVAFDPRVDPQRVKPVWVRLADAGDRPTIAHGPYWSLEGDRAVVQVVTTDSKDRWIARLDPATGEATAITHDHDDAWLGGPPPVAGYLEPALFEWLSGGRFVFASERSGFCHLYLAEADGTLRALTSGAWEVRNAALSHDRSRWLITAGREDACDDHLYLLPAAGGELARLTSDPGRQNGLLSPDGARLAMVRSDSVSLPDLYLADPRPGAPPVRITLSGSDEYYRHPLARPAVVSFAHPDGKPVWGALYEPRADARNGAALLHIHGGGYRQFSHRGWSVYGYGLHLGLVHALLAQGYTVLDFDYRGGAGFGRDYRADIYGSMGAKDVDGAVAAVDYLVREHGIDRARVGLYGLSYGGFFTLMSLFRYPGVFAAGVANASVSDWAHYEHDWTSRILGVPYKDPDAYARSSPINHAAGLADPLLIVHGLIDENVQFQDSARLVQRLIELEKDFDVAYYPKERHVIESESSRYDYVRRVSAFFGRHLLKH